MQKLPVRAHFQVTSIYCLLGLALISMGISLASEQVFGDLYLVYLCILPFLFVFVFVQVKIKLDWFAYSTGMKEDEEAVIR